MSSAIWVASLVAAAPVARKTPIAGSNEEFFIVSSVNAGQGTMVLKRPTEVTLTIRVTPKTRLRDERGNAKPLASFRAGDTVFIVSERLPSGEVVASSIREGIMTPEELRRRYLRSNGR